MQCLPATAAAVEEAARLLKQGDLVALPTETVYGLAAHALLPNAVLSVFAAKERPAFDPLIVHVIEGEPEHLEMSGLVDRLRLRPNRAAVAKLTALWPGPLTLVLPKGRVISDEATSGLDTVAIRCPAHPVMRAVIARVGAPLVAPSANRFGRVSPTTASAVVNELSGRVGLVLDGGACEHGVESTIVGFEDNGTVRLLRPGALPRELIEAALGIKLAPPAAAIAPGMLSSHYAPRKPVVLWSRGGSAPSSVRPPIGCQADRMAALLMSPYAGLSAMQSQVLSACGDDREAARNLFAALRALDSTDADWILAELPAGMDGLFAAIRDRLSRAAAARSPEEATLDEP